MQNAKTPIRIEGGIPPTIEIALKWFVLEYSNYLESIPYTQFDL